MADGMAAVFMASGLFIAAGALAVQTMEIHHRAEVKYQAAMVGRRAMEGRKANQPLIKDLELQGHRYEVRCRKTGGQNGYDVWEVEVGDEGGKQFSCRRLAPIAASGQRLDDDGSAAGHDLGRPDLDGLPALGQSDRADR